MVSPPSVRLASGGGGQEAAAVVMPAGGGLVPSAAGGPAQGEGEPGPVDEPGGVLAGKSRQPGGLGDGQPDRCDCAGAWLPAAGGDRRVAEGNWTAPSLIETRFSQILLSGEVSVSSTVTRGALAQPGR